MTTRYATIYADPPWEFKTRSAKGKGRSAEAHYDCMPTPEIKALPVADLAAPTSCLFLWTTNPVLPQALDVMAAWGFTFKAVAFCWVKRTKHGKWHFGGGHWTRANAELCLLGVRGEPKRVSCAVPMLVEAQLREHSRKPDEVRAGIERLVAGPYVELFARQSSPGWATAFSDESKLFDAGPIRTRRFPSSAARPSVRALLDAERQMRLIE